MKRVKLTRTERRVMGHGRHHWSRSRGHHVTLHPRHDTLDPFEGLGGLDLSLLAVEGRPKAGASGAGEWSAVRVPINRRPRGLPLVMINPFRPGGSLVVVDQRRIESGGQTATIILPMLIPLRVGTSHAGIGWPVVEEARWGVCNRGSVPLWMHPDQSRCWAGAGWSPAAQTKLSEGIRRGMAARPTHVGEEKT
jgi:hypothetical protein